MKGQGTNEANLMIIIGMFVDAFICSMRKWYNDDVISYNVLLLLLLLVRQDK